MKCFKQKSARGKSFTQYRASQHLDYTALNEFQCVNIWLTLIQ